MPIIYKLRHKRKSFQETIQEMMPTFFGSAKKSTSPNSEYKSQSSNPRAIDRALDKIQSGLGDRTVTNQEKLLNRILIMITLCFLIIAGNTIYAWYKEHQVKSAIVDAFESAKQQEQAEAERTKREGEEAWRRALAQDQSGQ